MKWTKIFKTSAFYFDFSIQILHYFNNYLLQDKKSIIFGIIESDENSLDIILQVVQNA